MKEQVVGGGSHRFDRLTARCVVLLVMLMIAAACSGDTASGSGELSAEPPQAVPLPTAVTASEDAAPAPDPAPEADSVEASPEPTPTPTGPEPFVVVALMGETNIMRFLDGPAVAGVSVAIDEINEAGGLLGRPVELRRFDIESRKSLTQRFAERLLRDPPDLVIVSCDVAFAEPALELADAEGWITISPCADDIGYQSGAWGSRNFTLGASAEPRGAIAAEIALERYGDTAMVLRDVTSPEAERFCNGFERTFRELGGAIVYRDRFTYDTLEPLLDRLAERGRPSSSIVLCSHVPGGGDATPNIITQIRLGGFTAPIVSGLSVDERSWFASVPTLNEMTYVSWSSIFGNDPDNDVNRLLQAADADPATPAAGVTTVLGADAVEAWARAVEAVRSADPSAVAAAMSSFADEPMLTGNLTFAGGTRMDLSRVYRVVRITGGQVGVPELVEVAE